MVSLKVEWEVVCAAWNGDIADDLEWPVTAPFSVFCINYRLFCDHFDCSYPSGKH